MRIKSNIEITQNQVFYIQITDYFFNKIGIQPIKIKKLHPQFV